MINKGFMLIMLDFAVFCLMIKLSMSKKVKFNLEKFFKKWLMKLKFPNLRNIQIPSNNMELAYFYLSVNLKETFQCETPCTCA